MLPTRGYAAYGAQEPLKPFAFERRDPKPTDVHINDLEDRGLISRRPDDTDRRRQLIEITAAGIALLESDRAERDAWLRATMRDTLSELEVNLLMLVAPVLRKLADADVETGPATGTMTV